ncbi:MAG: ATP-binding cassette domain-containing protein, partial [Alphaproteobacteria bacterium]
MLEAQGLHVGYGDAPALWDVSLAVAAGECVSVIGPNGAGKTTLVNAIARLLPIRQGRLRFDGSDVTAAGAQDMCNRGVALIPEGRRLFSRMTVEENLDLGSYRRA